MSDTYNISQFPLRNPNIKAEPFPMSNNIGGYYVEDTHTAHVPTGDTMLQRGLRMHEAGHSVHAPILLVPKGSRAAIADQLIGDIRVHLGFGNLNLLARRDEMMLVSHEARTYKNVKDRAYGPPRVILALSLVRTLCIVERLASSRGIWHIERPRGGFTKLTGTYGRTLASLPILSPTGLAQARNIIELVKAGMFDAARKAALEFLEEVVTPPPPPPPPGKPRKPPVGPVEPGIPTEPTDEPSEPSDEPSEEPEPSEPSESEDGEDGEDGDSGEDGESESDGSDESDKSDSEPKTNANDAPHKSPKDALKDALDELKRQQKQRQKDAFKVEHIAQQARKGDVYTLTVFPLTNSKPRNTENDRGRTKHASADCGSKIRVSRLYDAAISPCAADVRLFKAKLKGGSILLDCSGSMSLKPQDVEAMLVKSPAATIAGYCAPYSGSRPGTLNILAQRGYMVRTMPYLGGDNYHDALALEWLASQAPPFTLVSDLQFTGPHTRHASTELAKLLKRGLKVYYNLKDYYAGKRTIPAECQYCHAHTAPQDSFCRECHKHLPR